MPLTMTAKNQALDATVRVVTPTLGFTHVGLQTKSADITGLTSDGTTFTKTAHGLTTGDMVVFSALTGGSALVAGAPYFVVATGLTANAFQVAHAPGGATVTHGTNVTAGTVNKLTEISGGSPAYARVAIAWAAAAAGVVDDSTNGATLNIPAGGNVDYVSFHSASTAGTVMAIQSVTRETFASQGTYTVTDAKINGID